jgi:hypothetical protein
VSRHSRHHSRAVKCLAIALAAVVILGYFASKSKPEPDDGENNRKTDEIGFDLPLGIKFQYISFTLDSAGHVTASAPANPVSMRVTNGYENLHLAVQAPAAFKNIEVHMRCSTCRDPQGTMFHARPLIRPNSLSRTGYQADLHFYKVYPGTYIITVHPAGKTIDTGGRITLTE